MLLKSSRVLILSAFFAVIALGSLTFIAQSRNSPRALPKRQDASTIVPPGRAGTARASRLAAVGIAPTGDPGQGFDIEGDLRANTPNADTTDWVPGVPGAGIGVLTAGGVPLDPTKTFRLVDLYDSTADNSFDGGSKLNENPNTDWAFGTGKPPQKDDLNNGLLHVSIDSNNHVWFVAAADRLSNNGNSFVDIEFLQNTLVANANGTFTSNGPSGGRTVGDIDITLELTQGGTQPNFFVQRWQSVGPGVFDYVNITPPAGTTFSAANIGGPVSVPFGAFGSTTYDTNTFAEVAIDITALIAGLDQCVGIKTVLIKTKTSQSSSSVLKDFITPIQLNLGTGPTAVAGPDLAACQASEGPTVFNPVGSGTNGSPSWSVVSTTGTANAAIVNGTTFAPTINVTGTGTVNLRLTVSNQTCPPATDDIVLTVSAGAVALAGSDQTLCQVGGTAPTFQLTGVVTGGSTPPFWSVFATTGTASANIVSPNSLTTDVIVSGIGTATIRLTSTSSCGTQTDDVLLTVNAAPTASAGADQASCQNPSGTTLFTLGGAASNGTPTWSVLETTGTASAMISNPGSLTSGVSVTGVGTVTLQLLVTSSLGCASASDDIVLTVNQAATVSAGAPQSLPVCPGGGVALLGSFGGAATSVTWTTSGSGTFSPDANTPTATYFPSSADLQAGSVILTLTTNDPAGPCAPASSQTVITFLTCVPSPTPIPETSDQRPGSILFYPVYTSNPSAPAQQNTRFSITNTNQNASAFVHLFFVDGTTCSIADLIVCLTPNQTMTSFAAELDPGVTGYLIAVAVDSNGCPISFNHLIGDAYVKFESGHFGNYGAEQIAAAAEGAATCDATSLTALLEFDGTHYGRIPRVLAIDSILSPGDNNSTLIFIDRFGGDLQVGAARIGNLFGVLFGDQEDSHSWGFATNLCQFRGVLSDAIPRTVPRFQNVIPAGTTGWLKFWGGDNVGLFGTSFNFNSQSPVAAGAFSGARNMHKLRLNERVTLTIPVFPPAC